MFNKKLFKWVSSLGFFAVIISLPMLHSRASAPPVLATPIVSALSSYSTALSAGVTANTSLGSSQMDALVNDRRSFYQKYVTVALNLNYVGLKSEFNTGSGGGFTDTAQGNTHQLEVSEIVTLSTKSQISSPDEYPLVQSVNWAIKNASTENNVPGLQGYLQDMTNSVNDSLKGASIQYFLRHKMVIEIKNSQATIVQDSYDDKSVENINGYDVVTWADSSFTRTQPDFTQAPDYQFFHTPVEVLGQRLLDAYKNDKTQAPLTQYPPYQHGNAATYINRWVRTTTLTCNSTINQNTANYNPAYTPQPCNDCANFVSQALYVGALQQDTTWHPYTTAWVNVPALITYLGIQARIRSSPLSSLQPGDISETSAADHVVMYSASNPARFNGHTNDRYKAAFSQYPTLTIFYAVV